MEGRPQAGPKSQKQISTIPNWRNYTGAAPRKNESINFSAPFVFRFRLLNINFVDFGFVFVFRTSNFWHWRIRLRLRLLTINCYCRLIAFRRRCRLNLTKHHLRQHGLKLFSLAIDFQHRRLRLRLSHQLSPPPVSSSLIVTNFAVLRIVFFLGIRLLVVPRQYYFSFLEGIAHSILVLQYI